MKKNNVVKKVGEEINMGVLIGYAKLAEAVVLSATHAKNLVDVDRNLKFAEGVLLRHFCDIYGYDHEVFYNKIVKINKRLYIKLGPKKVYGN